MQLPLPFPTNDRIEQLLAECGRYQQAQFSPATSRGYAYDWKTFTAWCARMGLRSLPATPETISIFIADLLTQGRKVTGVTRHVDGVAHMHRVTGHPNPVTPEVRTLLRGARRVRAEGLHQMQPITLAQLREVSAALVKQSTPLAVRNRAIVLVGFASALRRSNLASLRMEHVLSSAGGVTLKVEREKQDPLGKGRYIGLPHAQDKTLCPVRALHEWLEHRGRADGALFWSLRTQRPVLPNHIYTVVKKSVALAGIDASGFGPHSLRAGFITEAGEAGVGHLVIAAQTGHRSLQSLQRYFRPVEVFKANACALMGL